MTKLLLFPYHPDILTIIEYRASLVGFELCGVASFIEDTDIVNQLNFEIRNSTIDYRSLLAESDAVLFLDNYRGYNPDKYYKTMHDALRMGKKAFITPLAAAQLELDNYEGDYELLVRYPIELSEIDTEYRARGNSGLGMRMYKTDIPILSVLGQGKCCSKFETQLFTKDCLSKDYEVSWVSTNALGVLFGSYTLPPFLYSEKVSFQEKIIKFNYFMHKVVQRHPSDCILLGIPEGVMPFRQKEFNHFAEFPLIISTAVNIDVSILCFYFTGTDLSEERIKQLANYCYYRFGIQVTAAAVSKTTYHLPEQGLDPIEYVSFHRQFLENNYHSLTSIKFPLINLLNRGEAIRAFQQAIQTIKENADTL